MTSLIKFTLTLSSLFFRLTAQVDCDQRAVSSDVNATDRLTITNFFQPPVGPYNANISSNWTWQLSTQSPAHGSNGNTNIQQSLSLSISPPPSPGLFEQESYAGCGIIIHGAWHKKVATHQGDLRGDCTGFISDGCRQWMISEVEFNARYMRWKNQENHDGKRPGSDIKIDHSPCQKLAVLKFNATIQSCKDDFAPGAWGEPFTWASSSLKSSECAGDTSSFIAHTWGASSYNSTSLQAYNDLTTSIEPIITTLHVSEQGSVSWAKAHIICLRSGKHVSNGSSNPHEIPEDVSSAGARQGVLAGLLACVLSGLLANTFL